MVLGLGVELVNMTRITLHKLAYNRLGQILIKSEHENELFSLLFFLTWTPGILLLFMHNMR